jgi:hypothetical protein
MSIFKTISRALFGGKARSKAQETQSVDKTGSSTVAPYAPAVPYVTDFLSGMNQFYDSTPAISPMEQQGYDAISNLSGDTSALDQATRANSDVMAGKYLTPESNPYLASIAKRVGGGAMEAINSTFGGQGRTGSGAHQQHAAEGVGQALNQLYYTNYGDERGRMDAAIGRAPQLSASRFVGPQMMLEAGQAASARPFDINSQRAGILGNIARLGSSTNTQDSATSLNNSNSVGQKQSGGLMGRIMDKLFQ